MNIAFVYIAMNSASALILNGPHAPPAQAQRTVFCDFPRLGSNIVELGSIQLYLSCSYFRLLPRPILLLIVEGIIFPS